MVESHEPDTRELIRRSASGDREAVDGLLARGTRVVGIDDFDPWYDPHQKRKNLRGACADPLFSLVEADLCSVDVADHLEISHHIAAAFRVMIIEVYRDAGIIKTGRQGA